MMFANKRVRLLLLFLCGLLATNAAWAQQWTSLASDTFPNVSDAVAYAPNSNRLIRYSSWDRSVWALNNANGLGGTSWWMNIVPAGAAGSPPSAGQVTVSYDVANNRLIAFGGCRGGCLPVQNAVWVLSNADGSTGTPTWQQLSPSGTPPAARTYAVSGYDPATNSLVIFGGHTGGGSVNCAYYHDTWVLSHANGLGGTPAWAQLPTTGGPPPGCYGHTGVYDTNNNVLIVMGGWGGGYTNAVWALSHANGQGGAPVWTNVVPEAAPGAPSVRGFHGAIYNTAANRMAIFGGVNQAGSFNDTWVLEHANGLGGAPVWTQVSLSSALPSARYWFEGNPGVAYDSANDRMIVVDGNQPGGMANDTWVLSSATVESGHDLTAPTIAPTITGQTGDTGWYTGAVSVVWAVADPESGIASSNGCTASNLAANTAGTTLTCSAVNGAGLSNSASVTIKIDQTAPVITPNMKGVLGNDAWYTGPVTVSWNVADADSGVSTSSGCDSTNLTGDTTGTVLTCSAKNGAGLTSTSSVTLRIRNAAAQTWYLLVNNLSDNSIKMFDSTGTFIRNFAAPNSGGLRAPALPTLGPDGNVYVGSMGQYAGGAGAVAVKRFDGRTGAFLDDFIVSGTDGPVIEPYGLAFGPDGNFYIGSGSMQAAGGGAVQRYDGATGAYMGTFVPSGTGGLSYVEGITFGLDGNLYVADVGTGGGFVARFDGTTGAFMDTFVSPGSGGTVNPVSVRFGPDGNLYLNAFYGHAIKRYNGTTGAYIDDFVPAGSGGLYWPADLAFGPDGNLYVSERYSAVVNKYDGTTGAYLGHFMTPGSGGLSEVTGLLWMTPKPGPAAITAVAGNGQSATVDTAFADPLVVRVSDGSGSPVAGATVTFSGSGVTFSGDGTATTDATGRASIIAAAAAVGSLSASASVSGVTTAATFALTGLGATQSITFPNPGTQTYGAAPITLTATASSGLPVTYTVVSGPATVSGSMLTITGAGTVNVQADQAGDAHWLAATPMQQTFTVSRAVASVTPNAASKTYGEADPVLTGTLIGFLPGDNVTATFTRVAGETVAGGPYAITATVGPVAALANYDVTYSTAAFTINKRAASVTPNAASKMYGDPDPAFTGTLPGFLPGDGISATYTRTTGEGVEGSPYVITAVLSPAGVLVNYEVAYSSAPFTITRAALSVTANNQQRVYGAPNPPLDGVVVGIRNGDPITATFTTAATPASIVGGYPIVPLLSDNGTGALANYVVTAHNGALTVLPATTTTAMVDSLSASGAHLSSAYNETVTFTASVAALAPSVAVVNEGLVNFFVDAGTTPACSSYVVNGAAACSATMAFAPGPHTISASYANGGGNFNSSPSATTLNHLVQPRVTTTTVSFSPLSANGTAALYKALTVTVTITDSDARGAAVSPSGTVTLESTETSDEVNGQSCSLIPVAGSPASSSCSMVFTPSVPDGRFVTASYQGDAYHLASDNKTDTGATNLMVTAPLLSQQVCLSAPFNGTAIGAGNYLWFNSVFQTRGQPITKLTHITFFNQTIQIGSGNSAIWVANVPDAEITFDPTAATASTTFDDANNIWYTTLPTTNLAGKNWLGGTAYLAPSGLPGGVKPVTWCGYFTSDDATIDLGWQWAAAVYTSFSSNNNVLGIKPVDDNKASSYQNSDHGGTPENYRQFVTGGARGGGGNNYTGGYSGSLDFTKH